MSSMRQDIYILAGVTASGKSDLAIAFAKKIGGVIINGDSRQVYKELKIGSAQPVPDKVISEGVWELDGVKHYLYGHKSLSDAYTVVDYQNEANALLETLTQPVIIVGGSGLFIDSVAYQYVFPAVKEALPDLSKLTIEELVKLIPTEQYEKLNPSDRLNRHRLIQVISRGTEAKQNGPIFKKYFVLNPEMDKLQANIEKRTAQMFKNGLLDEVYNLWESHPGFEHQSLRTIGYFEFLPYLEKHGANIPETELSEIQNLIVLHTRQYAKRQRTWFKRNAEAIWITEPKLKAIVTSL